MKAFSGIKGIIFDLGSTLIEYENHSWKEINYEGEKMAYDSLGHLNHQLPDFEEFHTRLETVKQGFREQAAVSLREWKAEEASTALFRDLGVDNPEKEGRLLAEAVFAVARKQMTICGGAGETLAALRRRGLRTGLISNTIFSDVLHEGDLKHFGLAELLGFRLYSSGFGWRKPRPEIFLAGLKHIGLEPGRTVYVGDRYMEDVAGPTAVGMGAVLKFRAGREYPDPMPDGFPVIETLPELLELL